MSPLKDILEQIDRLKTDVQTVLTLALAKADLYDAMMVAAKGTPANGTPTNGTRSAHKNGHTKRRIRNSRMDYETALLDALKGSSKGMRLAAIASKVGWDKGAVAYRLHALRQAGKVRVKGVKRSAVWLPV